MAAQTGKAVLIKVAVSGTQTTIGGLRSSSITLNDEMVDVTNKDSTGNSRVLLPQGGVTSGVRNIHGLSLRESTGHELSRWNIRRL